ncbi:MAG: hypothetical protein GY829_11060 [Gammaproteobacteria bacterium]|nr:hypothetical protein [Gammaproteobacteria bacterium]
MSDYYVRSKNYVKGTTAKSVDIVGSLDAIEVAFAKLPTLDEFQSGLVVYKETTGSANTYAITMSNVTAYSAGISVLLSINVANTGPSTLNINGLGAVAIKRADITSLSSGDLKVNGVVLIVHDGTQFVLASTDPNLITLAQAAQAAAELAQDGAETAEANVETIETNVLALEAKAQLWAEEDEDVEVEAGEYSARHYAIKALAAITGVISVNTRAGAVTLTASDVGLANCDDTTDLEKPVSTATQTALDAVSTAAQTALDTVSTATQTALDAKEGTITLTANRAIETNSSGKLIDSDITTTELSYLDNATSNIQAQINSHTSNTSNPHSVTAADLGLENCDNTSDTDKPVSTAAQTALDLKANLASPALTGNPTTTTQSTSNNSTRIASTNFVRNAIASYASADASDVIPLSATVIGSTIFAQYLGSSTTLVRGATTSGANLASAGVSDTGNGLSIDGYTVMGVGTWRLHGHIYNNGYGDNAASVWIRIA